MVRSFWWGGGDGQRQMNWVAWNILCRKKEEGDLAFRYMKAFNLALLAKQMWCLAVNKDSLLSRVLSSKYIPDGDVLAARLGSRPSFTWRSIFFLRWT